MGLTTHQRKRLEGYIERRDRGTEPVFVGRKDMFALVDSNARSAEQYGSEGLTVCITGPPGIGKTAFLKELEKRGSPEGTLYVRVSPYEFHNPQAVVAKTAEAMAQAAVESGAVAPTDPKNRWAFRSAIPNFRAFIRSGRHQCRKPWPCTRVLNSGA